MLDRKQNIRNEDWIEAMAHIEETVSRDEIDSLADTTVGNIRETVDGKNAAYAWSGGQRQHRPRRPRRAGRNCEEHDRRVRT